ncbi:hypothetical protein DFH07DRAFT_957227 [Mycena maculata]|uniref:Uncharacterized protein n=1 Tax=Mycena maculata TaxID=230809 RepID=A0AAD7JDP2_9AGAR|nr:hypothetical protein DFH07DRAFT_957227 [Mycena maculata]
MTSEGTTANAADRPSVATTEFHSALAPGANPGSISAPVRDVALSVEQASPDIHPHTSASPKGGSSSSRISTPPYTVHLDENGHPYLLDHLSNRLEVIGELSPRGDQRPSRNDHLSDSSPAGVPTHHLTLFGSTVISPEPDDTSSLTDSVPVDTGVDGYPELNLDIDPDTLSSAQIAQLNAIRGHIGTANARILVTTAIVAEQQAATEEMQNTIQDLRTEVVSKVDSLRNEVNSQRSRLNRCLDDNLRMVRETGASSVQVNEILRTMNRNGGANRADREAPPHLEHPAVAPREQIPSVIRDVVDQAVSPHGPEETAEQFDRRTRAALRTRESTHQVFPLPGGINVAQVQPTPEAPRLRFLPTPGEYTSVGSASRTCDHFEERRMTAEAHSRRIFRPG